MNTAERIQMIGQAFTGRADLGFKSEQDLWALVEGELGSRYILDCPVRLGGAVFHARAPERIYHVCASNLAVSAETSLMLGLLLGSKLDFKLPSSGLPAFEKSFSLLPQPLRETVSIFHEHDIQRMAGADAVVVYGSDETISEIRKQTGARQRFLGYGHKISLGVVLDRDLSQSLASKAAHEILAYEQLGCLSPQAYFCETPESAAQFARLLSDELGLLRNHDRQPLPEQSLEQAALRRNYLERTLARGEQVLQRSQEDYMVVSGANVLETGPGHGCVQVLSGFNLIDPARWKGRISSVSFSSEPDRSLIEQFCSLGASRFCKIGELQNPPLLWRHDGRPRLGDLVTWVTFEF
ncbi:MAG: acyl-CoA reductase [Methylacidiphilales bacterium]|nr:acyl-CoA reductase [Candidatus Methylacidiphilales bacterium]